VSDSNDNDEPGATATKETVFGNEFDVQITGALREKSTAAEFLEDEKLQQYIEDIAEAKKAELGEDVVRMDTSAAAAAAPANSEETAEDRDEPLIDPHTMEDMSMDSREQVDRFQQKAHRLVDEQVVIAVEPDDVDKLTKVIQESVAGREKGDKITIFSYDAKLAGESITHPMVRRPPMRAAHYDKFITAALTSRCDRAVMSQLDRFMICDAGRQGLRLSFL